MSMGSLPFTIVVIATRSASSVIYNIADTILQALNDDWANHKRDSIFDIHLEEDPAQLGPAQERDWHYSTCNGNVN